MKSIGWDQTSYRIDGRPAFLVSGEFHYFRVPKADWRVRLELFLESGGNCVATYIPWILHEPTEGDIRFGDAPERDLESFLDLCRELEIFVIARPGPYQYSELKYDGLPGWLCENYPEILARNVRGEIFRKASVSYLHPVFLDKVRHWFDAVCPIIARHTLSKGGPVAFVQFDNELTGVHEWFGGGWDYNGEAMGIGVPGGRYPGFLRERYKEITVLNAAYETAYPDFPAVLPFNGGEPRTIEERRRVKDYQDFYFAVVAEYASVLTGWFRENGIDCDVVHNAANPTSNPYFLETAARLGDGFLLGSDHYYNLDMDWEQNSPSPKYAGKVFASFEMLRLMGFPASAFELPSGSCSDWPPATPEDLRCCYLTNTAFGMKGVNYYIFTGGPNPAGTGAFGEMYDYGAPIGAHGEIRPLYHVQKEFNLFLREHAWLATADRAADLRIGLDWEQSRCKSYFTNRGGLEFSGFEAWELMRKGLTITALSASFSPKLTDLASDRLEEETDLPLFVATSACMAQRIQENLIRFVGNGGRLLIAPVIPVLDEDFNPCTLLRDFLGGASAEASSEAFPTLEVRPVRNVLANVGLWFSRTRPDGARRIAVEEHSGREAGWSLRFPGGGQVVWLGLAWKHSRFEHIRMFEALLNELGRGERVVACDNPNVWTSLQRARGKSMLFLINLFSSPLTARVSLRPTGGGQTEPVEYRLGPMEVKTVVLEDET